MRPTKALVAKLDHNMLDIDMGFNATCCVAISLIGLLSLASIKGGPRMHPISSRFCHTFAWTLLFLVSSQACCAADPVSVRVAAISFVPKKFGLKENADRLAASFRKAAAAGAKIAVSPEGALDGYVVNEIIAGKHSAKKIRDVAIAIDGPVIQRFQSLAVELKMCLVVGFAELVKKDVFNCAVFIDDQGKICGKYHKMQFAEGYHSDWWFNRLGKQSRAFDTPYGRCGVMICNDRWNPLLAKIPTLDGAQFLVIPSFGSKSKSQDEAVLNRARESHLPIIEANVGVTLIVNNGKIAALDRNETGITYANITIPPSRPAKPKMRDQTEAKFLKWRALEMQRRYQKTLKRLKKS
jgi:predicted amidohydrolase